MPFNDNNIITDWVNLYTQDLFNWAYYKTSDQEDSEDLVQETFIAAFQAIDKFEWKSNPKTWLFSILNNKVIDYHRKKYKNLVLFEKENSIDLFFDENGDWSKNERPREWTAKNDNLLDDLEFRNVLQSCMKKLPENWSSAIHLKYLQEKEGKEICQDLGITATNFWQILHRAKLQLRRCLELNWFKK